jgi:hypothetical protein
MEQNVDLADDDTEPLRVVMLDLVDLLLPVPNVHRAMRRAHDLLLPSQRDLPKFEHVVAHPDDHALPQERPACKRLLPDELLCDALRLLALVRVLDGDDHGRVLRVGHVDVDAVVAELSGVGESLHGGEAGKGGGAEVDAGEETLDELETVEGGHDEGRGGGVAVDDVGEKTGDGGREEGLEVLVVDESESVAVCVSSSLFRVKSVFSR